MRYLTTLASAAFLLSVSGSLQAQQTGQPASNVLSSEDIYGNPTFVGGVTNGGPNAHSVW
jgi:hypothetical protein